jgi:A/G-specific adenine glycosylase
MLQQTRVEVVVPRYLRFLERFPDIAALAGAKEDEVLAEWSGLGYYRRARALREAARAIRERHGGEFPRDLGDALRLPGIGAYTAGAVLSIAYNLPEPIVDGNVARVLSRILAIRGDPRRPAVASRIRDIAASLIPRGRASEFNQSLMELGALICLPASPLCPSCPAKALCRAERSGDPERFPEKDRRRAAEDVRLDAAVIERRGKFLLERPGDEGPSYLRGLWGFPMLPAGPGDGPGQEDAFAAHLGGPGRLRLEAPVPLGEFRHSITFRRITVRAHRFAMAGGRPAARTLTGGRLSWQPLDRLGVDLPASSLALKIARTLSTGASEAPMSSRD